MTIRRLCDFDYSEDLLDLCKRYFSHSIRTLSGSPAGSCSWSVDDKGRTIIYGSAVINRPKPVYLSLGQKNEKASFHLDALYGRAYCENARNFMLSIGRDIDDASDSTNPGWLFANTCRRVKFLCNGNDSLRHAIERELLNTMVEVTPLSCVFMAEQTEESQISLLIFLKTSEWQTPLLSFETDSLNYEEDIPRFFKTAFPGCSFKYSHLDNQNWLMQESAERDARWKILAEELVNIKNEKKRFSFDTDWGPEAAQKCMALTREFYSACIERYGLKGRIDNHKLEFSIQDGDTKILDREAARNSGEIAAVASRVKKEIRNIFLETVAALLRDKIPEKDADRFISLFQAAANGLPVGRDNPYVNNALKILNNLEYPVIVLSPDFNSRGQRIDISFKKKLNGKMAIGIDNNEKYGFSNISVNNPKSAKDFIGAYMNVLKKLAHKIDVNQLAKNL